jgi:phage gpG-like protein
MALGDRGIQITLKGNKEFQEKLKRGSIKLSDGVKLHSRMGVNLLKLVDKGFKTEGEATTGKKWKGLAASTKFARRKGKGKKGPKILQDKGILRASFTSQPEKKKVRVGTAINYAEVHEFGGKKSYIIKAKNKKTLKFMGSSGDFVFPKQITHPKLPKRKILPTRKIAQALVTRTYDNFIKESLKSSRLN